MLCLGKAFGKFLTYRLVIVTRLRLIAWEADVSFFHHSSSSSFPVTPPAHLSFSTP